MTTSSITSSSTTTDSSSTLTTSTSSLDKDGFLKLFIAQMRQQDPMAAANGGGLDAMEQMTQMSILEQVTNLAATQARAAADAEKANLTALIGRTVAYSGADGTRAEGLVEQVVMTGEGPRMTIGGVAGVKGTDVLEVR